MEKKVAEQNAFIILTWYMLFLCHMVMVEKHALIAHVTVQ